MKYKVGDKISYMTNVGERHAEVIGFAGVLHGFLIYDVQSLSKYKNKFRLTEDEIHGFIDGSD